MKQTTYRQLIRPRRTRTEPYVPGVRQAGSFQKRSEWNAETAK